MVAGKCYDTILFIRQEVQVVMRGSCLCGTVRYEISGRIEEMHHCHCGMCRKAHGGTFSTYGRIPADTFRFTAGEDSVRRYRSSPQVERSFCGLCGSNLLWRFDELPDLLWVAAGSFDEDPGVRPAGHIFTGSKAPWHEITDGLPQHIEYPPQP